MIGIFPFALLLRRRRLDAHPMAYSTMFFMLGLTNLLGIHATSIQGIFRCLARVYVIYEYEMAVLIETNSLVVQVYLHSSQPGDHHVLADLLWPYRR